MLAPDLNKIAVPNAGTFHGFIVRIPIGGQAQLTLTSGAKDICPKAQNKERKNITSEPKNKIKPSHIAFSTYLV